MSIGDTVAASWSLLHRLRALTPLFPILSPHPLSLPPPQIHMKGCRDLNREDDYQARKNGQRMAAKNGTAKVTAKVELRGLFWHPRAYGGIPGCKRNLSVAQPWAPMVDARLRDEVWGE